MAFIRSRHTQGSARVTTKDQMKRCITDAFVVGVIIGELGSGQPFVPVSHCRRNEMTQISLQRLIGNFRLTVSLRVKGRRHTQSRAKKRNDLLPERTRKAGITIRNKGLTQSLSSLD